MMNNPLPPPLSQRKKKSMAEQLGIDIDAIGTGRTKAQVGETCAEPFNVCINWLITFANNYVNTEVKNPSDEIVSAIDRINRILKVVMEQEPLLVLERSYPNCLDMAKHIEDHNPKPFLDKDYSHKVKEDDKKKMIYDLIYAVKTFYGDLKPSTQSNIWEVAEIMLLCSYQFKDKFVDGKLPD